MLVYSHIWDALLKLVTIVATIVAAVSLHLAEGMENAGVSTKSTSEGIVIALCVVFWVILYRQYVSILSSWLYARTSLRTPVTFSEAKALRRLFQLDLSGTWLPLREIKKMPQAAERHDTLVLALSRFGPQRRPMLL